MSTKQPVVPVLYGIGNPLMDIIVRADQGAPEKLDAVPGSMNLVDYEVQKRAIASGTVVRRLPGGSCANTIRGTQWLLRVSGSTAATMYTGAVGSDDEGHAFESLLDDEGVHPVLAKKGTPTGSSVIVVTPDSQRTMFTYLGACREMTSADLETNAASRARLVHLTGYMWDTPDQEKAARHAVELARSESHTVSFDVADRFVVDRYRDSLLEWISDCVDLLFANEDELAALTGTTTGGEDTIRCAGNLAETVVMKCGADGCLVLNSGECAHIPAYRVDPIDTTGAGDSFAGGFLFGMIQKQSLDVCAKAANRLAASIVEQDGCNYDGLDQAQISTVFTEFS